MDIIVLDSTLCLDFYIFVTIYLVNFTLFLKYLLRMFPEIITSSSSSSELMNPGTGRRITSVIFLTLSSSSFNVALRECGVGDTRELGNKHFYDDFGGSYNKRCNENDD